jgi:hypothetical protein
MLTVATNALLLLVGVVFIRAGVLKLAHLDRFRETLLEYDTRTRHVRVVAVGWAVAEALAGLTLAIPVPARAVPLMFTLAASTGAVVHRLLEGKSHDCGCNPLKQRPLAVRIARNNAMICLAAGAYTAVIASSLASALAAAGVFVSFFMGYLSVGASRTDPLVGGATAEIG